MQAPNEYEVYVMAAQMHAYVQQTVKHIPCKLPHTVVCYFDGNANLVGYSCSVWAKQTDPLLCVARIDLIEPSIKQITYTHPGMIAQGEWVRAYLNGHYGVFIFKSYLVRIIRRPPDVSV